MPADLGVADRPRVHVHIAPWRTPALTVMCARASLDLEPRLFLPAMARGRSTLLIRQLLNDWPLALCLDGLCETSSTSSTSCVESARFYGFDMVVSVLVVSRSIRSVLPGSSPSTNVAPPAPAGLSRAR
jgi:hypothetical protein